MERLRLRTYSQVLDCSRLEYIQEIECIFGTLVDIDISIVIEVH